MSFSEGYSFLYDINSEQIAILHARPQTSTMKNNVSLMDLVTFVVVRGSRWLQTISKNLSTPFVDIIFCPIGIFDPRYERIYAMFQRSKPSYFNYRSGQPHLCKVSTDIPCFSLKAVVL